MNQPNNAFAKEIRAEKIAEGRYRLDGSDSWAIAGNLNGGFLLAAAGSAGIGVLPHGDPLSASGHYLAPVQAGTIDISTRVLSTARSNSVAEVVLMQNEKTTSHFVITATDFAHVRGENRQLRTPPELQEWDSCQDVSGFVNANLPGLRKKVIIRYPENVKWWEQPDPAADGYSCWVSHADESPITLNDLLMFADVTPPAIFACMGPVGWVPTLQLSIQLRQPPVGSRLRLKTSTRSMAGGLFDEDVELWDEGDNLVALSRQLVKLRKFS